jgi:uncharacterized protein YqeY
VADDPETPGASPGRYAAAEPGSLKARLGEEMRAAMRAREKVRLGALRMLSAAVTNREVELGHALSDQELVEVAAREAKRRDEAAEAFAKAGRDDRAALEREEKVVLETYLPPRLSDEELDELVEQAVSSAGATGPGDFGKVMGRVMAEAKGRADGRIVQEKVRARLS